MKRLMILLILIAFVVVGCEKNKVCNYSGMAYNSLTDECECVNYYEGMVLDTGYNLWSDVVHYMQYYSRDDKPYYPYYSREGDSVKVNGWINHKDGKTLLEDEIDSRYVQFVVSDDSITAMNAKALSAPIHIEGEKTLFEGVDQEKECYMKGVITFHPKSNNAWLVGPADPEPSHNCSTVNFALCIMEIKN